MKYICFLLCLSPILTLNAQKNINKKQETEQEQYEITTLGAGIDRFPDMCLFFLPGYSVYDSSLELHIGSNDTTIYSYEAELRDSIGNVIEHYFIKESVTKIPARLLCGNVSYFYVFSGFDPVKIFEIRKYK